MWTLGRPVGTWIGPPSTSLRLRFHSATASLAVATTLALATLLAPSAAFACGGFFCFTQPVDQSAERILYVQQAGKITVHIQISYTGDDKKFSWVLPLQAVPTLGTGSDTVFSILEQATAPTFQLQWQQKDGCNGYSLCEFDPAADGSGGGGPADGTKGVVVLKEEIVGPYKSAVIKGNSGKELVAWLNDNGYVQPPETEPLVDSYAKQGFVFLALQLQKDKGAGDLVPVVVTLDEVAPCLPLRLTKLAVQPDMPIVAWVLGQHRAIPKNFLHVVLNDAMLDWLQPGTNYKSVVSKAVDQASGHAFTTELAKKTAEMPIAFANKAWDTQKLAVVTDPGAFLRKMMEEGYPRTAQTQALIRKFIPKPAQFAAVSDQEFYNCIQCDGCNDGACKNYKAELAKQPFDSKGFAAEIQTSIVEPLFQVQGHYDALPWVTRLYTTISGNEMDKDPIFAFNPDLPAVERLHTAKAEPICEPGKTQASSAKLTFSNGQTLEVALPKDRTGCQFDFGRAGTAQFGKGQGPVVAAGGQPAAKVEVLDESGPALEIDPRVSDLVDAELNKAELGKPSLSAAFRATLPKSTWNPSKTTVDPLPGGNGGADAGGADAMGGGGAPVVAKGDSGCSASGSGGGSQAGLAALLLAASALALRRKSLASSSAGGR